MASEAAAWPYRFSPNPKRWDRSCHVHPTPETDRLDVLLNELKDCVVTPSAEWVPYCISKARERNRGASLYASQRVDPSRTDEEIHRIGAWGEIALFIYFGMLPRLTVNTFRAPDLPLGIEIRTRTEQRYELKISADTQKDPDDRKCVHALCGGMGQSVRFAGWITAGEGRMITPSTIDPHYAGRPFHAVREHRLRPMRELKELVEQWKQTQTKQP